MCRIKYCFREQVLNEYIISMSDLMKRKSILITVLIAGGLLWWNIAELPDFSPDASHIQTLSLTGSVNAEVVDWTWFDDVKLHVTEAECRVVSLRPELEALDGKTVVISGASFACGDDIIEGEEGYTIGGFILVPYFGMIDCCVGNPIPYFQWTIVVEKLRVPWRIPHKGIIDPTVVVEGVFRIERESSQVGVFFLDQAEVVDSAEHELQRPQHGE